MSELRAALLEIMPHLNELPTETYHRLAPIAHAALAAKSPEGAAMEARLKQDGKQELPAKERVERTVRCIVCGWHTPGIPQQENWDLHETIATLQHVNDTLTRTIAIQIETIATLQIELSRERERHQDLRQVVKEYRSSYGGQHDWCGDAGIDPPCALCRKADALLEPKPQPAPVDTGGTTATE